MVAKKRRTTTTTGAGSTSPLSGKEEELSTKTRKGTLYTGNADKLNGRGARGNLDQDPINDVKCRRQDSPATGLCSGVLIARPGWWQTGVLMQEKRPAQHVIKNREHSSEMNIAQKKVIRSWPAVVSTRKNLQSKSPRGTNLGRRRAAFRFLRHSSGVS